MWLLKKKKPGIKNKNLERYDSVRRLMWLKCAHCGKLVYYKDYKDNLRVCPECNHLFGMTPKQRFDLLFDSVDYEKINLPHVSDDPLGFVDLKPYTTRLAEARKETGYDDAIAVASGAVGGVKTTMAVMNIEFNGGSMGRAVGEGIIAGVDHAIKNREPFVIVTSSGGARMQENVLALMQMARTTSAIDKLKDAKLPYIVILTDPTFGGVTASFAMLGDVHIAESGARIGFAGRRVIEQNIREKLPNDFQTSEYLYEHGMIDIVTTRAHLKDTLSDVLAVLMRKEHVPEIKAVVTPKTEVVQQKTSTKSKSKEEKTEAYTKVLLARNENRPHFLDYINGMVDRFTPLAGDRLYAEDPALIGGLGYIQGIPVMIMGQEKGRTIETRQKHRFGMPNPEGYRKAARLMRLAEKCNLPVITLVDTTGAFAGLEAEERGQSEAVASSIHQGLSIKTPYISMIVGEGGSGGAIAVATGNTVMMLENAIYSVIAPESCASILWRDNQYKMQAAAAMKLTASELKEQGVIDKIVMEPAGGAHLDWATTMDQMKDAIVSELKVLGKMSGEELLKQRRDKFLQMTRDNQE